MVKGGYLKAPRRSGLEAPAIGLWTVLIFILELYISVYNISYIESFEQSNLTVHFGPDAIPLTNRFLVKTMPVQKRQKCVLKIVEIDYFK